MFSACFKKKKECPTEIETKYPILCNYPNSLLKRGLPLKFTVILEPTFLHKFFFFFASVEVLRIPEVNSQVMKTYTSEFISKTSYKKQSKSMQEHNKNQRTTKSKHILNWSTLTVNTQEAFFRQRVLFL